MALTPLTLFNSAEVRAILWVEDTDTRRIRTRDNTFEDVPSVRKIEVINLSKNCRWNLKYTYNGFERAALESDNLDIARDLPINERFYLDSNQELEWSIVRAHPIILLPGSVSTPANLGGGGSTASAATIVTDTLSPSANALVLVQGGLDTNSGNATLDSISDTFSDTLTWASNSPANAGRSGTALFWGTGLSGSPGTGACTITLSVANTNKAWVAYEVTGHDTSTPASETTKTANGNGSTQSITMDDLATGGVFVSGICDIGNQAISPGTNETEINEGFVTGSTGCRVQAQYSTDTTQDWSNLDNRSNLAVAIELLQDAGGAAPRRIFVVS